jgi:protein-L-isoaspartate(D-aspartate) O-methyltransferase
MILSYEEQRAQMVERQLAVRGIRDRRVLEAMARIPREVFIPEHMHAWAYGDDPVSIGLGQTISQPFMAALMAERLALRGDERVLDVGAGSGYMAALLGALAAEVIAIEILPELAAAAADNLAQAGIRNVRVVSGDGSIGYPEEAPYQAISVDAAAPEVPHQIMDQLDEGGRLVIPVGSREDQALRVMLKRNGKFESRMVTLCRFVPLVGESGFAR